MSAPRENRVLAEPATPETCRKDYGSSQERDQREAAADANRAMLPLRVSR
ncbi:hypothetical protein GCM10010406_21390 [Streptomyces thermolineatus]|uniref:Uncharacterized protein n=1 Tax=Streptomyces thermolineatus TaxID=44033 RepID=A0ABN3LIE3_9ACTN